MQGDNAVTAGARQGQKCNAVTFGASQGPQKLTCMRSVLGGILSYPDAHIQSLATLWNCFRCLCPHLSSFCFRCLGSHLSLLACLYCRGNIIMLVCIRGSPWCMGHAYSSGGYV